MKSVSKNRTTSKFVAKLLARAFILLLAGFIAPIFLDKQLASRMETTYIYIENKWAFVFPLVLLLSFLTLVILAGKSRFEKNDLNWMLSLNALILIIYLVLLFIRLYPLMYS